MNQADPSPRPAFEKLRQAAIARWEAIRRDPRPRIKVCTATCGIAAGALETRQAFAEALAEHNLEADLRTVGCLGHCYAEPIVIIENPGFPPLLYHHVNPGVARMLVRFFLVEGDPAFEHVLGALEENDLIPTVMEFPRFHLEKRVVLDKCGAIDPEDVYDYLAEGGYAALVKALESPSEQVIQEIANSGLRGRGGAGFSTGLKWLLAREAEGRGKIVICNADEGDPGAYMDRTILESNPHLILEGLAICAYAVGAQRALVYVRAEYPLAVKIMTRAIDQAYELGLIGPSVLGTHFSLEVSLFQGSGAFVCGEETALIQSIEGRRGMPVHRPPFPVEKGLYGRPTVIDNVKTLASVPPIIEHGAAWHRRTGTTASPGTAIFSVVGDVVHPGLVEVPMGVSLRTLIFDVCGGIPNKKKFKAVQIGGPSGGCLPEEFLDTPIDFDSLTRAGAMMGSGGLVVMDEDTCLVDIARYFLDFTQKESCGKCTFCRIGTYHLLQTLNRITRGEGVPEDLRVLEELSRDVKAGSLCGLGRTAPNPVITSLKYFLEEYRTHVEEKRCPAGSCRPLTAFYIDLEKCARGCDACVGSCPVNAIFTTSNRKKGVDQSLCVKCGECLVRCPPEYDAVRKVSPPSLAPIIERPQEEPL
ncbi:MAG: NADH-ubiquinone oxidoreductase-F iron-sulfur binding region domain-containing protein [Thermodesulfobacteriota bacterium]